MNQISNEFEKNLEKYAEVIIKVALNLQPGQKLCIYSPLTFGVPLEIAPLVRLITKIAYQNGARFVEIMWYDEEVHLSRFQNAPIETFNEFPTWKYDYLCNHVKEGNPLLYIIAFNPELLSEQDSERIKLFQGTYYKGVEKIVNIMKDRPSNNSYITAPVTGWANKVFFDESPQERTNKLWDKIFEMCRIKYEDPISAWREHVTQLKAKCDYLTNKQYSTLKFNAPGTDLIISLPKNHIWRSGSVRSKNGIDYIPNIPTEEIFTIPHKDKTEGFVSATKPIFENKIIEDFKFTFSDGKITEISAKKGGEILQDMIKIDDGANKLGEVALVPNSSPISQMNMLFYNGLIDENASCHLALGRGFRICLKNGEKMSDKEFAASGGNQSNIHTDFMIGSGEMDLDGIKADGTSEAIMRNGEWVFNI
ncbi:MAG: aminopeptidase [Candidatus Hermodarchaeota archaeon]